MELLDSLQDWLSRIHYSDSENILTTDEKQQWREMSEIEKNNYLTDILTKPILFEGPEIIFNWYFRTKWGDALKAVHDKDSISAFEVGAGCCDILPVTISMLYNHSETKYTTANLNKELTAYFKERTQDLSININIIEDDANKIEDYIEKNKFDVIIFEHSANDVIETILANKNNIDTIYTNWLEVLPQITEIVNNEYRNNTLEKSVKKEFIDLLSTCLSVLKPEGWIIFTHYQFQYNLDIGLDPNFNKNVINIVRKWITDEKLGEEVFFKGFESKWWMFIKNT